MLVRLELASSIEYLRNEHEHLDCITRHEGSHADPGCSYRLLWQYKDCNQPPSTYKQLAVMQTVTADATSAKTRYLWFSDVLCSAQGLSSIKQHLRKEIADGGVMTHSVEEVPRYWPVEMFARAAQQRLLKVSARQMAGSLELSVPWHCSYSQATGLEAHEGLVDTW